MAFRFRHALLLIVVVGGLLRLVTLGERSLWLDELTSLQVSSQPLATIAAGDAFDNHTPPLYYLLLHLWWWLVPQSEFWLRLPSLLVDLVNIALVGVVFSHQFSRRVGLAAAAVFAVSEYALGYHADALPSPVPVTVADLPEPLADRYAQLFWATPDSAAIMVNEHHWNWARQ